MKRFLLFNLFSILAFSSPGMALVGNLILGLSAPQGNFGQAELDNEQAGFARMGFAGGLEFSYPVAVPGMYVTASVLYVQNKLGGEKPEDDFAKMLQEVDLGSSPYSLTSVDPWLNIPILAGLKYEKGVAENTAVHLTGMAGVSMISAGKRIVQAAYEKPVQTEVMLQSDIQHAIAFCWGLDFGMTFFQHYNIGIRYLNMGKPEIEDKYLFSVYRNDPTLGESLNETAASVNTKIPISLLFFTVGYQF